MYESRSHASQRSWQGKCYHELTEQGWHSTAPAESMNEPCGQGRHMAMPAAALYEPGTQAVHQPWLVPLTVEEPAGQGTQR